MLKIITSVVLSLVTIMAVTLFAVTVPAQSQKIEDNAAAIVKAQTDAETNAYNKVKEDILSDMSGSTLEDVGTAISALQDDVSDLKDKKLYRHDIYITKTSNYLCLITLYTYSDTIINTKSAIVSKLSNNTAVGKMHQASGWFYTSGDSKNYMITGVYISGANLRMRYRSLESTIEDNNNVGDDATISDTVTQVL